MRHLPLIVISCILSAVSVGAAQPAAAPVSFAIAPLPRWVKTVDAPTAPKVEADNGGMLHLLIDRQQNVEPRAYYCLEVRQ